LLWVRGADNDCIPLHICNLGGGGPLLELFAGACGWRAHSFVAGPRKKMTRLKMDQRRQRISEVQAAAFVLCASAVWTGADAAGPPLPVPCAAAGACGPTGAAQWVTGGSATAVAAQNALRINQTTNSAILNWSSFNIAAGNSVTFQQPSSSSIALNRIFQNSPSEIFGQLNANGQIYLINQNGFLFGAGSSVNVGSLLVSSLPLALWPISSVAARSSTASDKGLLQSVQIQETQTSSSCSAI